MNQYIGHEHQIRGVERYVLQEGKGAGLHILQVRNGNGLEIHISADRCADISRMALNGVNLGYFSPCGYVSPQYYDKEGTGFLRSFTAGFMTTCGLTAVGTPCVDGDETLPLHGTIGNTPATVTVCEETEEGVRIKAVVRDACLFARKLVLTREYFISYGSNRVTLHDTVVNEGGAETPIMLLYHCNMGYPLLDEDTEVVIPNHGVVPRDAEAAKYADTALRMERPQPGFAERCYYYDAKETGGASAAGAYQAKREVGVVISYDRTALDRLVEWKMMGATDYVLGLEPGNCTPDGRDVLRSRGELKFLQPGERYETHLSFTLCSDHQTFQKALETPVYR
ncbi:MAG: aldose 1-epimerase family protein [Oscillospiraceae bacterium]|nr:aldose 1-epimerase family protein [Oscillospiraceae bacterium]